MANIKINDLVLAGAVSDTMQLETDTTGTVSNKITAAQLRDYFGSPEQQIFYVGAHGSDLNTGRTISQAFKTVQKGIDAAEAEQIAGKPYVIRKLDASNITESNLIITKGNIHLDLRFTPFSQDVIGNQLEIAATDGGDNYIYLDQFFASSSSASDRAIKINTLTSSDKVCLFINQIVSLGCPIVEVTKGTVHIQSQIFRNSVPKNRSLICSGGSTVYLNIDEFIGSIETNDPSDHVFLKGDERFIPSGGTGDSISAGNFEYVFNNVQLIKNMDIYDNSSDYSHFDPINLMKNVRYDTGIDSLISTSSNGCFNLYSDFVSSSFYIGAAAVSSGSTITPASWVQSLQIDKNAISVLKYPKTKSVTISNSTPITLSKDDMNNTIVYDNATTDIDLTLPNDYTIPIGSYGYIIQINSNAVKFIAGGSQTIKAIGSPATNVYTNGDGAIVRWFKYGVNSWILSGDVVWV